MLSRTNRVTIWDFGLDGVSALIYWMKMRSSVEVRFVAAERPSIRELFCHSISQMAGLLGQI